MESSYSLTSQQHQFFEENGYLVITDGFTKEDIENHQVWANTVHDLPQVSGPCDYLQYDEINNKGKRVLCRVENFAEGVLGFGALLHGAKLVGIVSQLEKAHMVLFKDKCKNHFVFLSMKILLTPIVNYKFAGSGGFAAHIDRAGYGTFSNLRHLSIAIAIDPAHSANGGMEVVPGSHKMDIPIGADNTLEKGWVNAQQWIPVDLQAGKKWSMIQIAITKLIEL